MVHAGSQPLRLQQTVDASHRVDTGEWLFEPALPKPRFGHRFQRVQASCRSWSGNACGRGERNKAVLRRVVRYSEKLVGLSRDIAAKV